MRPVENVRFFIGPMSKNVVDAVLEFCDENDCHDLFGLIPSRRQVDVPAGYSNGWTTPEFVAYVGGRVAIQRDHAGPCQGATDDSGLESLRSDVLAGIKALHIDPWKAVAACDGDVHAAAVATATMMVHACRIDDDLTFEIGTEQAVRSYDAEGLQLFIDELLCELESDRLSTLTVRQDGPPIRVSAARLFEKVTHIVVQTGTGIGDLQNTGAFDAAACSAMLRECNTQAKLSKEHNSDYLSVDELVTRLRADIHAFNFAPEFGVAETKTFMRLLREEAMHGDYDEFKRRCVESGKWVRWTSADAPNTLKAYACGHYFFSELWCVAIADRLRKRVDFDGIAKATMKDRLHELLRALEEANRP